jgi:alpha-glucosidase (family GH31 glycosyl hydrolase)
MRTITIFFALVLILPACGEDEPKIEWGVEVEIFENPPSLGFVYQEREITSLAAFYLTDGETRTDLTGPCDRRNGSDSILLTCELEDGRDGTIEISPAEEDAAKVVFLVRRKGDEELLGVEFGVDAGEGFYGLMERVVQGDQDASWQSGMTEALDLRGQEVFLMVRPTVSTYSPFFVSSAGYGVYAQTDWPGTYRFGVDDPTEVSLEYEGPELPLRIIPGPEPIQVTERYSRTVGTTLMPPDWVFGPWRWRDEVWDLPAFYEGTAYDGPYCSMIVEDMLMMEALGIPCDLYWVDRPWATGDFGYDDFAWDENRLPQPVAMINWMEGKGTKFALWIAPWAKGNMADQANQNGYAVENAVPTHPFDAPLIDLTDPAAVEWWQDAMGARIQEGVLGFKLDRGEEKVPDGFYFKGQYHDGTDFRPGRNLYPFWYAKAVHGAFERAGAEEYMVMPRSGWVGSSQHAIFWGGDTKPSHWGLRSAIIAVQRNAVMNFPVWGSDTCGYGRSTYEVCARWLAFSAFCPLMEVGPTDNVAPWSRVPDGQPGNVTGNGYDYTPEYNQELIAIWILYANIHNDLKEYTIGQAQLAHSQGTPIVRPMIYLDPQNPDYRDLYGQYLFGPDILVAPVWQEGQTQKDVHIPQGRWVDAWTGQEQIPGAMVSVDVPDHKIPIFIRAESPVDLGDLNARWQDAQAKAAQVPDLAVLAAGVE